MRRIAASVLGALTAVALWAIPSHGQSTDEIQPGVVVRKVAVQTEPDQTYALYLPSTYDPARLWPVIYAFDPSARGLQPVECFQEAAEKYGYVLVASNVSRNGPVEPSIRAGLAMIRDSATRFALNGKRVYATGFSGGARVACTMAQVVKGEIAGVIGCGAGFPSEAGPSKDRPFAFCGTIGNEDYNWTEMSHTDRTLESLGLPHRLLRFDGGHVWPPKDVAMAAVEWLELDAMKAARRPKDQALVASLLDLQRARAEADEASGSFRSAWERYADLVAVFRGLTDVGSFEAKVAALQQRPGVKDQLKRERDEEAGELVQMRKIVQLIGGLPDPEERFARTTELWRLIDEFKDEEKKAKSPSARLLARRMLGHVNITAFYTGQPFYDAKQYAAALPYLTLQARVRPDSAGIQFRVAVGYAGSGDKKKAIEALKKAVASGFSDAARIEAEPAFDKVREDVRFKLLVDEIKARPPA